jgi:hypothetical protein
MKSIFKEKKNANYQNRNLLQNKKFPQEKVIFEIKKSLQTVHTNHLNHNHTILNKNHLIFP